jgi:hypothetical protein
MPISRARSRKEFFSSSPWAAILLMPLIQFSKHFSRRCLCWRSRRRSGVSDGLRLCIINCERVVAEVLARHDGFGCRAFKRRDRNGGLLMAPRKGSARLPERHRESDGHSDSCRQYNQKHVIPFLLSFAAQRIGVPQLLADGVFRIDTSDANGAVKADDTGGNARQKSGRKTECQRTPPDSAGFSILWPRARAMVPSAA